MIFLRNYGSTVQKKSEVLVENTESQTAKQISEKKPSIADNSGLLCFALCVSNFGKNERILSLSLSLSCAHYSLDNPPSVIILDD